MEQADVGIGLIWFLSFLFSTIFSLLLRLMHPYDSYS